jgi:hypothetical protein
MANVDNTGKVIPKTLQLVYAATGLPVLNELGQPITKPNILSDPDYVAPFIDYNLCPNPEHPYVPTTTTSTTTTTTTTTQPLVNCSLIGVGWLVPLNQCNGDNTTTIVIGVTDSLRLFQFFNPVTNQWQDANIGTNKFTFTIGNVLTPIDVYFRVKNCSQQVSGIVNTCSPSNTTTSTSTSSTSTSTTTSTSSTSTTTSTTTQSTTTQPPCNFYNCVVGRTVNYLDCNGVNQSITNNGICNFQARSIISGILGIDYNTGFVSNCLNATTTTTTTVIPCYDYYVISGHTVNYIDCNGLAQTFVNGVNCNIQVRTIVSGVLGVDYGNGHIVGCGTTTTTTTTLSPCCIEVVPSINCSGLEGSATIPVNMNALFSCLPSNLLHYPEFEITLNNGTLVYDWDSMSSGSGNQGTVILPNFQTYIFKARYNVGSVGNPIYCESLPVTLVINCAVTTTTTTTTVAPTTTTTTTTVAPCIRPSNVVLLGPNNVTINDVVTYYGSFSGTVVGAVRIWDLQGNTLISGGGANDDTAEVKITNPGSTFIRYTVNNCSLSDNQVVNLTVNNTTVTTTTICAPDMQDVLGTERCIGFNRVIDQADGCGGTNLRTMETNSVSCGYVACVISISVSSSNNTLQAELNHIHIAITNSSGNIETSIDGGSTWSNTINYLNQPVGTYNVCARETNDYNCIVCQNITLTDMTTTTTTTTTTQPPCGLAISAGASGDIITVYLLSSNGNDTVDVSYDAGNNWSNGFPNNQPIVQSGFSPGSYQVWVRQSSLISCVVADFVTVDTPCNNVSTIGINSVTVAGLDQPFVVTALVDHITFDTQVFIAHDVNNISGSSQTYTGSTGSATFVFNSNLTAIVGSYGDVVVTVIRPGCANVEVRRTITCV